MNLKPGMGGGGGSCLHFAEVAVNRFLIVPIYKKGNTSEPENYRGVTLMSCLGKFFLSIINNRLMQYTIDKHILHWNVSVRSYC